MKKFFITAAAVLSAALLAAAPSWADEAGDGNGCRGDEPPKLPTCSEHINDYFNLSEEQQIKAKPIAEDYENQFKMSVQDECKEDLLSVLTPEQMAKLQELQKARMEAHKNQFDALKEQLRAILTPEQQAKLDEFRPVGPAYPVGLDGIDITIVTCSCNPRHPGCCAPKYDGWMAERLGLNEEQLIKFKVIEDKFVRYRSELEFNMDKSLTDYQAKMKSDVEQFLTPEQKDKLAEILKSTPKCSETGNMHKNSGKR